MTKQLCKCGHDLEKHDHFDGACYEIVDPIKKLWCPCKMFRYAKTGKGFLR